MARLGLRLSPAGWAEFQARLRALLDEFADRPDDPSAPAWSVFLTLLPDPAGPDQLLAARWAGGMPAHRGIARDRQPG